MQRIKHLENRLSVVKSNDLLGEVGQCLSELHGVRLSISSFQFEKIEDRFLEVDSRLVELEKEVFQQIFASFHSYADEFSQFNNNFDMSFLLEHVVHPATRRWLVDIVGKWMSTEKQLLVIAGKQGTGKSAICSALANLVPHYCLAVHKVKEEDLLTSIILSFSQQLGLGRLSLVQFDSFSKFFSHGIFTSLNLFTTRKYWFFLSMFVKDSLECKKKQITLNNKIFLYFHSFLN